jgi:hypothetical protein
MSDANSEQLAGVLLRIGLSPEDIVRKFRKYSGMADEFRREAGM